MAKIDLDSVKLGMKLVELKDHYGYKELVEYLKGTIDQTYYLFILKPLWDKYGYNEINKLILKLEEPNVEESE